MAADKTFKLNISKVDGAVFSGDVVSAVVPGIEGEMTILADHAALISPLRSGQIELTKIDGEKVVIDVQSGTLEVSSNSASILL